MFAVFVLRSFEIPSSFSEFVVTFFWANSCLRSCCGFLRRPRFVVLRNLSCFLLPKCHGGNHPAMGLWGCNRFAFSPADLARVKTVQFDIMSSDVMVN
jgi:hypothetical protein